MSSPSHRELASIAAESYQHATLNVNECECLIKIFGDYQVVAFRGTETDKLITGAGIWDVITDMRIIPWYDKDLGWMHSGFLSGGRASAEELKEHLSRTKPIYLTGHSLGGALSLVVAGKLKAAGFDVVEWVGFGSPKAQFWSSRVHNVTQTNYRHCSDAVPLKPRVRGYRHNYPVIRTDYVPGRKATWDDHDIVFYTRLDKYVG